MCPCMNDWQEARSVGDVRWLLAKQRLGLDQMTGHARMHA